MINRYQGNSGRVVRYPEHTEEKRPVQPRPGRPQTLPVPPPRPANRPGAGGLLPGLGDIGRLLPDKINDLEMDDIILLLILYLMYRESGDSELLIIMGAMFLL